MTRDLVLASTSPFRRTLMENAGLEFSCASPGIDERALEADERIAALGPLDLALELAGAKACAVSTRLPQALVIGCDQTMSLGDRIFHKAENLDKAKEQLKFLRGKTHNLNSALVLAVDGQVIWRYMGRAEMTMRSFSDRFLDDYMQAAGDGVLHSVGCYQLESIGIQLFESINGDYFTIIGLPMIPLLNKLRDLGQIHE